MNTKAGRLRWLLLVLLPVTLLLAACGDDDDDDDDASATTAPAQEEVTHEFVPLDVGGPNTKRALETGDIDIALLFSSDGAIAANGWVALEDDQNLQPVDNFAPAVRTESTNEEINEVLNEVSAALEQDDITQMVADISIDGQNPADVAAAFLEENDLPGDLTASGSITVGGANFTESEVVAELYAGALEQAGVEVDRKLQLGSREAYYPALRDGEIDLIPEFIGTLLTVIYEGEATTDVDETVGALREEAEADGITILEPSPADSVNAFVVTGETADEYGLETVSDLAGVEESLTLGGPPECPERPACLIGLEETYGLDFGDA